MVTQARSDGATALWIEPLAVLVAIGSYAQPFSSGLALAL